jgi:hypothetical protein
MKEVNYHREVGTEKVFELSALELSDIDTILAYIFRPPDSDFYEFLHRLELLFLKVSSKGKSFNSLW